MNARQILALGLIVACAVATAAAPAPEWKAKLLDRRNPVVRLVTTQGDISVELLPKAAPRTVANFLGLAEGRKSFTDPVTGKNVRRRFYDGTLFFRVIPDFMIQGGDRKNDGTGSPGYSFADEISAAALGLDRAPAPRVPQIYQQIARDNVFRRHGIHDQASFDRVNAEVGADTMIQELQSEYRSLVSRLDSLSLRQVYEMTGYVYQDTLPSLPVTRGVMAMANAGPNTNGSQFFLTDADCMFLNGKHTVFGRVIGGQEVIARIARVPRDPSHNDRPLKDVVLEKVIRLQ